MWYAYTHPFDRESYNQSLQNPTAYELETLTPKQVLYCMCWFSETDRCAHPFDEQNMQSSDGQAHEHRNVCIALHS